MTVRRIMILLYGAGGVPGRGEIPMIQIMKILVLQYDMQKDGGVVLPSHMGRDIEIILPQGVDHIIIEKEEIAPKTVSRCNVASADFG